MAGAPSPERDHAAEILDEVLAELGRAGIRPTPLSIIASVTDKTTDDALVLAVVAAADRRDAFGARR